MKLFLNKFSASIKGKLSGFDRIVIKGIFKNLNYTDGMFSFLLREHILLKDFSDYVKNKSMEFKNKSYAYVEKPERPNIYLSSSGIRKKEFAQEIVKKDNIEKGLICLLKAVEPFYGYAIYKNREKKKLELVKHERKCLHLYYYWCDDEFGFCGARVQTWFPYTCYIYLNGREWLERMLIKKNISYTKIDNCFVEIEDYSKAQNLLNKQLETNWPEKMNKIARIINPLYMDFHKKSGLEYYWTIDQSEWATDIAFNSEDELQRLYKTAVKESISLYSAKDVMRFVGKKLHGNFKGELTGHYQDRPEGIRVRHSVKNNSIKMYDKHKIILRIETTINDPSCFKMYRPKEGDDDKPGIYPVRKSVADIKRRAEISEKCNQRYLDSLAALKNEEPFNKIISPLCSPVYYNNRRARALRPWEEFDSSILKIIGGAEFNLSGFRNKDIRGKLYPALDDEKEKKRNAARISRYLWILRAHGLIKRIPKTYNYRLTDSGIKIIPAILKTYDLSMEQLSRAA